MPFQFSCLWRNYHGNTKWELVGNAAIYYLRVQEQTFFPKVNIFRAQNDIEKKIRRIEDEVLAAGKPAVKSS